MGIPLIHQKRIEHKQLCDEYDYIEKQIDALCARKDNIEAQANALAEEIEMLQFDHD